MSIQDEIWKALQTAVPITQSAILAAQQDEEQRVAAEAERIGVSLDDYKLWCAGVHLPRVQKAVLKHSK